MKIVWCCAMLKRRREDPALIISLPINGLLASTFSQPMQLTHEKNGQFCHPCSTTCVHIQVTPCSQVHLQEIALKEFSVSDWEALCTFGWGQMAVKVLIPVHFQGGWTRFITVYEGVCAPGVVGFHDCVFDITFLAFPIGTVRDTFMS